MAPILLQFASQGITVIANGALPKDAEPPTLSTAITLPQTLTTNMMAAAIDWAIKAQDTKEWAHLDTNKIAAAGQSCGGFEAILEAGDPRVMAIGIFNSGGMSKMGKGMGGILAMPNKGDLPEPSKWNVPVFFFLGGPSEISSAKV
jgi:dienelactone hydrolase